MIGLTAAQLAQKPEQTELFTNVHITIGMGPDPEKDDFRTAGNTPTVAIFDKFGNRVGQSKNTEHIGGYHKKYDAGKAKKVWVKEKEVITLRIKNEQMEHQGQVDPAYLFLAALETDAPCIAAVSASGNGVAWNWFGDIAAQCPGIQWYASNKMVGDGVLQAEMCLARPRFLQGYLGSRVEPSYAGLLGHSSAEGTIRQLARHTLQRG